MKFILWGTIGALLALTVYSEGTPEDPQPDEEDVAVDTPAPAASESVQEKPATEEKTAENVQISADDQAADQNDEGKGNKKWNKYDKKNKKYNK